MNVCIFPEVSRTDSVCDDLGSLLFIVTHKVVIELLINFFLREFNINEDLISLISLIKVILVN